MGALHSRSLISADEFILLPEESGKPEVLDGEVSLSSPARLTHIEIEHALYDLLREAGPEFRVFIEAGYRMTVNTWLTPDVSVTWCNHAVENDYLQGSPMIAIEILSRGNTAREIESKTAAYLRNGGAEVWIINPKKRLMLVHRLEMVEQITGEYRSDLLPVAVNLEEILPAR